MIDEEARCVLAEALTEYLSGAISNLEFDKKAFAVRSDDPAVRHIRTQLWMLYDDLTEHNNDGKWKIDEGDYAVVLRTIHFLKSKTEYTWPAPSAWYSVARAFIAILTIGIGTKAFDERFAQKPDPDLWPFRHQSEISDANLGKSEIGAAT